MTTKSPFLDPDDPKYSDTPDVTMHPLEGRGPGEPAGAAVNDLDFRQTPLVGIDPREVRHYLNPSDIRNALCGAGVGVDEKWYVADHGEATCEGCRAAWEATR